MLAALARVPRPAFVPAGERPYAWCDRPLSIGHGQTISQPFIVALMTDLCDPEPGDRVLEIGTGCGYQTAVLAELVAEVRSVERVPELARAAKGRLADLGYTNVHLRHGDGYAGWPAHAPYDAILVTAAAPRVPEALVAQLAPHGRLVIPVGRRRREQVLRVLQKDAAGEIHDRPVLPVAFVPLVPG